MAKASIEERKRKGRTVEYVKVTLDNGRVKQYKYDPDVPIDAYIEAATKGRKEIAVWRSKKPSAAAHREQYITNLRRAGRLMDNLAPGVKGHTVELSALGMQDVVRKAYEKMLSPLVRDKQLYNIVYDNRAKLRSRFAYTLEYQGVDENEKEKRLGTVKDIGRKTIEEMYILYHSTLHHRRGTYLGSGQLKEDAKRGGLPREAAVQYANGTIRRVMLHVTFRKGGQ